ncbi:hypothetical protein ACWCOP_08895 [Maricaulaceae bacterium MS644]
MGAWLNTKTLLGVIFGLAFGAAMSFVLGAAAGIPMGLGLALMWAVVLNASRTAGGPQTEAETDKDAD